MLHLGGSGSSVGRSAKEQGGSTLPQLLGCHWDPAVHRHIHPGFRFRAASPPGPGRSGRYAGGGILPQGFLDYGGDRLVLSADGLSDSQPKEEAPSQPLHQEENAILTEIRAVNEAVDNEKLSAQIDRIGVITAKILDYQKSHPESSPQLHSF